MRADKRGVTVHDETTRDARLSRRSGDRGFTLLETMFTMAIFSIMLAIAAPPFASYRAKQEHKSATRELVAFLRRAQVRAVSEETTYRVDIASGGRTATVYRMDGTSYVKAQTIQTPSSKITYTPAFSSGSVYFYARGAASRGAVTVARAGSDKTYTVDVEGLTARVSYK